MKEIEKTLDSYSNALVRHPLLVLGLVLALSLLSVYAASSLTMKSMDNKDMLPKGTPVIDAMNYLGDEFGSTSSAIIVIEIAPKTNGSDEVRDVRDARAVEYADVLAQEIRMIDGVLSARSAADLLKESNQGRLSQDGKRIASLLEDSSDAGNYISKDYSMSLIRIGLSDNADEKELAEDIQALLDNTPRPPGIKAEATGSYAISVAIEEQIGPDMQKTSMFSLIGIFFVIYMLFRSLRYSFTSLMAILFGNIWAFGLMAGLGMQLSSMTSGAASMIMGIGIDFGIQVVSRFRQELTRGAYQEAMKKTIRGVTIPMATTTLAALIGFRAMSLGQLTIMEELGTIMSLGVFCCMAAAITVIPSLLIIHEKHVKEKRR